MNLFQWLTGFRNIVKGALITSSEKSVRGKGSIHYHRLIPKDHQSVVLSSNTRMTWWRGILSPVVDDLPSSGLVNYGTFCFLEITMSGWSCWELQMLTQDGKYLRESFLRRMVALSSDTLTMNGGWDLPPSSFPSPRAKHKAATHPSLLMYGIDKKKLPGVTFEFGPLCQKSFKHRSLGWFVFFVVIFFSSTMR